MKKYLLLILYLTITHWVYGQENQMKFAHLTVDNGLSQSWVLCITQDSYGYIWIGTVDGLNRYDGYNFKVYKQNPREKNTVSNNCIYSIYEDSEGNLWIGTLNGLNLYDRQHDNFISNPKWSGNYAVRTVTEDPDSNLWIASSDYLFILDKKTDSVIDFKNPHPFLQKGPIRYRTIYTKDEENVFIGTFNNGLFVYQKKKNTFINYTHDDTDPFSISAGEVSSIFKDSDGRLWIGTQTGLDLFSNFDEQPKKGTFIHFRYDKNNPKSISSEKVNSLLEDNNHNLWIGLDNGGLNKFSLRGLDEENITFEHFQNHQENPNSLSNNSVYALCNDAQGSIWIGTFGNGINIMNSINNRFSLFSSEPCRNSLNNNHVNVFCEDNDYIWIGTEGGLNRYNKRNQTFRHYTHDSHIPSSLSSNAVCAILKDKKGNLWIGTWDGGLNKFNYQTETFTHYYYDPKDKNSLSSNNIFSIIENKEGKLWIGTLGGGLNLFNPENNSFTSYQQSNSDISGDYIETVIETRKGDLWMENGNLRGQFIERFNKKTGRFELFIHDTDDSLSLSGTKVYTIFEDSKENLWVGTDAGLNLFNYTTGKFSCYQIENGLPDNSIKSIIEDDSGNLWLGSNKGLSKFIGAINLPEKPEFKNYSREDGLQSNEFNSRSCLKSTNGKLYFGGINGFNVFHPDSIKDNEYIPEIVFTELLIFNQPVKIGAKDSPLKQDISLTREIKLSYTQSVFSFKFAALNYVLPDKNQYAHMMEGFDKSWNYIGKKREVTFTNLDPGEYTFYVKASNNDGVWNEKGISMKIIIEPPWWKTLFFKISIILVISGIVIGSYFYRVNNLRKQKIFLETLVKQRTTEIEAKNTTLTQQTEILNETNTILEERQQRIEEQAEELRAQADDLSEKNLHLNRLNATKDKFFSIIAHDLRNPFNSILGFSELLSVKFDRLDSEKKKKYVDTIYQSTSKIYRLLENLLQWAKTQEGNMQISPTVFYLNEIITSNLDLNKNRILEKNIRIDYKPDDKAKVFADQNMINTVFRNLLTNSIKYTDSGEIKIKTRQKPEFWEISISDTGHGIPRNKLENIFNVSMAKSTEGTRGESGTGLGLIICKEFIEKNSGHIEVESEEGKGTTFTFTLPYKKDT